MTAEGVEKLISYQRAYFPREWKFTATQNDIDEIKIAYLDALEDLDDDAVLRGYLGRLRSWDKMPGLAQIMTAADGIARRMEVETAGGGWRCRTCDLPWNAGRGYSRETRPRRGEIRCPGCNALLERALPPEGYRRADNVKF